MTTIYKPVLIETAEQAEALPIGTIAVLRDGARIRKTLTKTTDRGPGPWDADMHGYPNAAAVGWTALVPIEAAIIEGFEPIGIEMEADYIPLIQHRIDRQAGTLTA